MAHLEVLGYTLTVDPRRVHLALKTHPAAPVTLEISRVLFDELIAESLDKLRGIDPKSRKV